MLVNYQYGKYCASELYWPPPVYWFGTVKFILVYIYAEVYLATGSMLVNYQYLNSTRLHLCTGLVQSNFYRCIQNFIFNGIFLYNYADMLIH